MKKTLFFLILISFNFAFCQTQLKLEDIMKGEEFIGFQPENATWSLDNETIYFEWNPNKEIGKSTYFWKKGMKEPQKATPEEAAFYGNNFITNDYKTYYYIQNGGLYSYQPLTKIKKRIFQNSNYISNLSLGKKEGIIFIEQTGNIIKINSKTGSFEQITNFSKNKTREEIKKEKSFLSDQQEELFQFIKDSEKRKEWYNAKNKLVKKNFPKSFGTGKNIQNLSPNPNEKFVTFTEGTEPDAKSEIMERWITNDGYNQSENSKDKVSLKNLYPIRFGIYNTEKDSAYFVDFSKLNGIKIQPKYFEDYKKENKEERYISFGKTSYSKDGNYAILDIRSQDNKDRWIVNLNLEKGTFEEIDHQHDEAWIGGPGIPSYSYLGKNLDFLGDNSTIYFQSEKTGFSHLYTYNLAKKELKQITSGNWEVRDVTLSKDKKNFYLSTNTTHPGNRDFYKISVDGGKMIPIFTEDGNHEVSLSPDEKKLLVRYSYKNKPWEIYWSNNVPNAKKTQITSSLTPEFKNYNWQKPEIISFSANDGKTIYARLYQPDNTVKNNAAIIFVHGAGYLQNAHNWWSNYFREYMFHNLLIEKGFTVLDIDYRASDGYGRDHRTGIYRFMGDKDLSDQIDGKNLLVSKYGIDTKKVGIYGGSYGGFITLMALLTKPGEFKAGAALRSVTDWAHYNHGYTGNILNFPETDPDAYKKSSPIYYANNLQDQLLMLHGMVDDNVEYKDIVRLSQRFIELGKKNWTLASYPVESHGFKETYSWVDEYRRILEHFEKNLLEK